MICVGARDLAIAVAAGGALGMGWAALCTWAITQLRRRGRD